MNCGWNEYYKHGRRSGKPEEYAISRDWKKDIIKNYCDMSRDTFLDIGCGDLQFWDNILPSYYAGVDISEHIIRKNKEAFPNSTFYVSNAKITLGLSADVVICFDMLWHILDDDEYIKTLGNLKQYAKKYIFIYTWNKNPFTMNLYQRLLNIAIYFKRTHSLRLTAPIDDGGFQKYRDFLSIAKPVFTPEFELIDIYTNEHWEEGSMYVFRRKL